MTFCIKVHSWTQRQEHKRAAALCHRKQGAWSITDRDCRACLGLRLLQRTDGLHGQNVQEISGKHRTASATRRGPQGDGGTESGELWGHRPPRRILLLHHHLHHSRHRRRDGWQLQTENDRRLGRTEFHEDLILASCEGAFTNGTTNASKWDEEVRETSAPLFVAAWSVQAGQAVVDAAVCVSFDL